MGVGGNRLISAHKQKSFIIVLNGYKKAKCYTLMYCAIVVQYSTLVCNLISMLQQKYAIAKYFIELVHCIVYNNVQAEWSTWLWFTLGSQIVLQ